MRQANRQGVLTAIRREPGISRAEVAERTGLTKPTVSDIVSELIGQGWVTETGVAEGGVGRRPLRLEFVPTARLLVGVDVGITRVRCAVTDLAARIRNRAEAALTERSPEAVVELIGRLVGQATGGIPPERLLGVGVGLHGLVDSGAGLSRFAPHFGWRDVPVRQMLMERLGLPIEVDNDVRAMAMGEYHFGLGRTVDTLICVNVGSGVGAGIVLNGQPYRGMHGGAGEVGHTKVVPDGLPCSCGGCGCLETVASGEALVTRAGRRLDQGERSSLRGTTLSGEQIFTAARSGDPLALELLTEAGHYLGVALANLVNLLNPRAIAVGGGMARAGAYLFEPMLEALRREALPGLTDGLTVAPVTYGADAGVIGSAALLLQPTHTGGLM